MYLGIIALIMGVIIAIGEEKKKKVRKLKKRPKR